MEKQIINVNKMPADNKRFGKIGGKVITRTSVCPLTVSDNPNGMQLIPNFAKPPGRYLQAVDSEQGCSRDVFGGFT